MRGMPIGCSPSGSPFFLRRVFFFFFQLVVHFRTQAHPSPFSNSVLLSLCPPAPVKRIVFHRKKSKPTQASFHDLFNGHLPRRKMPLFLKLFLPGFGAASMSAFIFPLKEAWFSLLCRVWLWTTQGRSKTWTLRLWARAQESPAQLPLPANEEHFCAFRLCPFTVLELRWALCHSFWGPRGFCVHSLIFVYSTYNMPPTSVPLM